MDPAHTPDHHKPHHEPAPVPPVAMQSKMMGGFLSRTSGAFVAEYCMFIISLGIALTSLSWLVYTFFALIVSATNGVSLSGSPLRLILLWFIIASLVSLPAAAILWSRTNGELLANEHFKGILPGGARGFRTFWIVLSVIGMIGMLILALYTPLATLVAGGDGFGQSLLAVTLPSIINLGFAGAGIYIITRPATQTGASRLLLWVITGLSALLFIVNFVWASNASPYRRDRTPPSYNDTYYDTYDY